MVTESSLSRSARDILWRLPDEMRSELAQVIGTIIQNEDAPALLRDQTVLSVGDVCSLELHKAGIEPKVAIVDFKTKRDLPGGDVGKIRKIGKRVMKVWNPQAVITRGMWDAVREAIEAPESVRIEVEGEEDLASLACIHHAQLGTTVIYGIPDVGMMSITVDTKIKDTVNNVLERMEE